MKDINQPPRPLPQEGFVRLPQVLHVLGIGKTTFGEGIKDGRFPAPVKLGPRTAVWRVEDIRNLISRISANRGVAESDSATETATDKSENPAGKIRNGAARNPKPDDLTPSEKSDSTAELPVTPSSLKREQPHD